MQKKHKDGLTNYMNSMQKKQKQRMKQKRTPNKQILRRSTITSSDTHSDTDLSVHMYLPVIESTHSHR